MKLKLRKKLPKIVLAQSLACTAILASGIYSSNKVLADDFIGESPGGYIKTIPDLGPKFSELKLEMKYSEDFQFRSENKESKQDINGCIPKLEIEEPEPKFVESISVDGSQEAKIEQKNKKVLSQGKCGANTEWKLEEDGTLTISGTGKVNSECWQEFEAKITHLVIESGEKYFALEAFWNYNNLKTVDIADGSIKFITDDMFASCDQLEKVNIGNGVICIGKDAFRNCFKLKDVYMPDTVECLGEHVFSGGDCIERVRLSNNLKIIPVAAFCLCTMLRNIEIPASVEKIEDFAFGDCKNLEHVLFQGDKTKIRIHIDAFDNTIYKRIQKTNPDPGTSDRLKKSDQSSIEKLNQDYVKKFNEKLNQDYIKKFNEKSNQDFIKKSRQSAQISKNKEISDIKTAANFAEAGKILREAIDLRKNGVTVKISGDELSSTIIANKDLAYIQGFIFRELGDYPDIKEVKIPCIVTLKSSEIVLDFEIKYLLSQEEEIELENKIADVLKKLDLSGKSEFDKVEIIANYIRRNVHVDGGIIFGYLTMGDDSFFNEKSYTAFGALFNGKAVCEGYAKLFVRFCEAAGLNSKIVKALDKSGTSGHMFNLFKFSTDDKYYIVDLMPGVNDKKEGLNQKILIGSKNYLKNGLKICEEYKIYPISSTDFCIGDRSQNLKMRYQQILNLMESVLKYLKK